ncbi:hypothetical protein OG786_29230 [Streptomyces sp. NBC_00101]|uniref:hypothetical protein n=1 Tax=Streptomyces sp. NBC_00101 TaxID=2975651 RepID=UPI003245AC34
MPQAWSIEVELGVSDVSDDLVEELVEYLIDCSPAVGKAPSGNLSARIFIEAGTARQAIDGALKEVTAAAKEAGIPAVVVGVDLVTEEELDRRLAEPSIPDLVGISEIAEMLNVVRQRATQLSQRSDFPPAVAHLKSGPVFVRDQVIAFERRWDRRSGRPAKPVDLTGSERDVLAAMMISMRSEAERESAGSPLENRLFRMLHLWPDPDHEGRLCARYPATELVLGEAIHGLARKRLLAVDESAPHDEEVLVGLELTSKGERVATNQL